MARHEDRAQGSKAGWPAPSCLLGQNQIMACLLPKAGDGKNTEVLQSQSHVSEVIMRLEKDLGDISQETLLCLFRRNGRRQPLGEYMCI